jgi:hypothetical protein
MTCQTKELVRWERYYTSQLSFAHAQPIFIAEYFRRFQHLDAVASNIIIIGE